MRVLRDVRGGRDVSRPYKNLRFYPVKFLSLYRKTIYKLSIVRFFTIYRTIFYYLSYDFFLAIQSFFQNYRTKKSGCHAIFRKSHIMSEIVR